MDRRGRSGRPGRPLIDLVIEPGMAFGTGQHATTRLCLEQIGALTSGKTPASLAQHRVLDVGTGTGILLIGAKKLGYGTCIGTDIEDDAILAAEENARVNAADLVLAKGTFPRRSGGAQDHVDAAAGSFELVLANILAVVILRLMDDLAAVTKAGGWLVLSGLLVEEEAEIIARAQGAGLQLVEAKQLNGWSAVALRKG